MRFSTPIISKLVCLCLIFPFACFSFLCGDVSAQLTGQLLVKSQTPGANTHRINEFDADGNLLQTIVPPAPPKSTDVFTPRDLFVNSDGQIQLFNGHFDPYVSTYTPSTNSWIHRTHKGWTIINNQSYGGIGQFGDNIFATNMFTSGNPSSGLIVINNETSDSFEIANGLQATDLAIGLDDSLWVLVNNFAFEFDPVTFAAGRSVNLSAAVGNDIRSIAVDQDGNFFIGDWGGSLSRLDSDGNLVASLSPNVGSILDVDVTETGLLAFGTRTEGAWLSTTDLTGAKQVEADRWSNFVAFVRPTVIPEPSSVILIAFAAAGLGLKRRRLCSK